MQDFMYDKDFINKVPVTKSSSLFYVDFIIFSNSIIFSWVLDDRPEYDVEEKLFNVVSNLVRFYLCDIID